MKTQGSGWRLVLRLTACLVALPVILLVEVHDRRRQREAGRWTPMTPRQKRRLPKYRPAGAW